MKDILNARLIGRTFPDEYGETTTVVESFAGLAPGHVCVKHENGRAGVESLLYVLAKLEGVEADLDLALSLLSRAERIREHAVALATFAASHELPEQANRTIIGFDDRMSQAAASGSETRKRIAADLEAAPVSSGPKP